MTKRRISASIDPDLLSAAEAAVKRRGSSNFSASFRPNENKISYAFWRRGWIEMNIN